MVIKMTFYNRIEIDKEELEKNPHGAGWTREQKIWHDARWTLMNEMSDYLHKNYKLSTATAFYNYLHEKHNLDANDISRFTGKDDTGIRKAFKLLDKQNDD